MGNAKMSKCKIAVIPGDGIGKEVVPEGLRVLEAAGAKYGIDFTWETFAWSCEYYAKHGRMMPEDGLQRIRHHDAIFLGAVGFPGVPDHISLWGLLIPIRRQFRQYANLRPVRLMPGVPSPLRDRKPGDIDFYIVRENNEGEYSSIGGRIYEGTEGGWVVGGARGGGGRGGRGRGCGGGGGRGGGEGGMVEGELRGACSFY